MIKYNSKYERQFKTRFIKKRDYKQRQKHDTETRWKHFIKQNKKQRA